MNLGSWKQGPNLRECLKTGAEQLCRWSGEHPVQPGDRQKLLGRVSRVKKNETMISCFVGLVEHRLDLIMAHTESRGLNYRAVLINTMLSLRSEEV